MANSKCRYEANIVYTLPRIVTVVTAQSAGVELMCCHIHVNNSWQSIIHLQYGQHTLLTPLPCIFSLQQPYRVFLFVCFLLHGDGRTKPDPLYWMKSHVCCHSNYWYAFHNFTKNVYIKTRIQRRAKVFFFPLCNYSVWQLDKCSGEFYGSSPG